MPAKRKTAMRPEKPARAPRAKRSAIKSAARLADTLTLLEQAGLVRRSGDEEDAFVFKHALTLDTAYESLLLKKRSEVHRRVADAIERLYPNELDEQAARLAEHYAEAGDDAKALEYSRRAGDAGARLYAYAEAITHYSRAVEIARERLEVSTETLVELYLRRGKMFEHSGRYADARANYEQMQEVAASRGDRRIELAAVMALVTILSVPTSEYNWERAEELDAEAMLLARELEDAPAQAKIHWNRMLRYSRYRVDNPRAIGEGEASLSIARRLDLKEQLAYSLNDLASLYLFVGRDVEGEAALVESRKLWHELGNLPMVTDNLGYAAMGHVVQGRYEKAIEESQEAWELGQRIGNLWAQAFSRCWIGPAYQELGRPDLAIRRMQSAIDLAGPSGFFAPRVITRCDLGGLLADFGAVDRGLFEIEKALSGMLDVSAAKAWAFGHLAAVQEIKGEYEKAEESVREGWKGVPSDDANMRMSIPLRMAEASLALAKRDWPGALGSFDQLAQSAARLKLWQAVPLALLGRGRALWQLDRREEALAAGEEARERAVAIHARWSLWQILAALARWTAESDPGRAEEYRKASADIVQDILQFTPPDLQGSFLSLEDVRFVVRKETRLR